MKTSKKVLITGGTGFVGQELVSILKSNDFEICTIGRSNSEDITLDLTDKKSIIKVLKDFNPNIIFHLASGSNIKRAEENKEKEYNDVVLGTQNLLESIKESNIKLEKFIYLSSQAIYGDPQDFPITELHHTNPPTQYGKNKLKAEDLTRTSGLDYLILRASSLYGKNQDFRKSGVISIFINKLKNNEPPIIFNTDQILLDVLYIQDLVECLYLLTEKGNIKNEIFNIGSGEKNTLKDILDNLYKFFPTAPRPKIEYNSTYKTNHKGIILDIHKISNAILWKPKYNLQAGLKEILQEKQQLLK